MVSIQSLTLVQALKFLRPDLTSIYTVCSCLTVDLRGRAILVTGANQGIGLAISHALAERGCTLYMVCRDEDRGKAAVKAVQNSTGNKDVHLKICNLACRQAIQSMTNEFTNKSIRIYLLIHNAGVMVCTRNHAEKERNDTVQR